MSKQIHIGDVSLPLDDFVVARTGVLGITRSGKTYTAKGIAEQLLDAGIPIVVFDAIGVWRYLKVPGDGPRAKGYRIVVAGGAEPDLPLTPQSAPEIVRAAIRENIPLVIDLYDPKLSKADWRKIVQTSFRTLLYENKGSRHIFLEESAEYAPQRIQDGETYAEVEKLARMGGNVSLGITFINQRAQELNKAVLELCDNLVLLRQRGSHAIEALQKWLDKVSPDTASGVAKALPHMTQGDCWVWAEDSDTPIRTRSRQLRSFHPDRRKGGAVAEIGHAAVDPKDFVSRMLGELTVLIEKAKQDDPRELRKQIAELRKQAGAKPAPAAVAVPPKIIEKPVLRDADIARLEKLGERFAKIAQPLIDGAATLRAAVDGMASALKLARQPMPSAPVARPTARAPITPRPSIASTNGHHHGEVNGVEQRILDALAELEMLGAVDPERELVAFLAGYTHLNSKGFVNASGALRTAGHIDYPRSGSIQLTESGRAIARAPDVPRSTEEVQERIVRLLGGASERILRPLIDAYPDPITREAVATAAGYGHLNSKGFVNAIGRLRTLGFVTYPDRGSVRAADLLFLNAHG